MASIPVLVQFGILCQVEPNSSIAVFGLGAVVTALYLCAHFLNPFSFVQGLAVIQGAKMAGASRIIAVNGNPSKFAMAKHLGATDFVDSSSLDKSVHQYIAGDLTPWGVDYSFDCTGNVDAMHAALEYAHRGWGTSRVIGVAAVGHELSTRPFQLVTARTWKLTAFRGFKSRKNVPMLDQQSLDGNLPIYHYITKNFDGVGETAKATDALNSGDCLQAAVRYSTNL